MATLIVKTYIIPTIVAVRTTCAGTQYTVETAEYTDAVKVNGAHITCTCGEKACSHIRFVQLRRAQDAAKRATYTETFDLSYGDAA
jgi:hypothetical protein